MFKFFVIFFCVISGTLCQTIGEPNCGIAEIDIDVTGLVFNGQSFRKGAWPWMAGLFAHNKYICGGSLISKSHILTAAHCIQDKGSDKPLNPKSSFFVVGKHNLESTSEEDYDTCLITSFFMHDDWKNNLNFRSYDADLAIAVLRLPVEFSRNIKPICLFPHETGTESVLNKVGRIAGWGETTTSHLSTANPTATKMTIVDSSDCIKQDPAFAFIMSHSSLCSIGNATGVCKGDSGSGLMLKVGNAWTLRGILSATTETNCVGGNYVTFTDAAQFADWILGIVEIRGVTTPQPTPRPQRPYQKQQQKQRPEFIDDSGQSENPTTKRPKNNQNRRKPNRPQQHHHHPPYEQQQHHHHHPPYDHHHHHPPNPNEESIVFPGDDFSNGNLRPVAYPARPVEQTTQQTVVHRPVNQQQQPQQPVNNLGFDLSYVQSVINQYEKSQQQRPQVAQFPQNNGGYRVQPIQQYNNNQRRPIYQDRVTGDTFEIEYISK